MGASFGKREREKKQQERAAAKRQRRVERAERVEPEPLDTAELMERYRLLSEAFASGVVERDVYEEERRQILAELGLSDAFET